MLTLSGFFGAGQTGYVLLVLLVLALLIAAYLWGSRLRSRQGPDELEQKYKELDRQRLDALPDEELLKAVVSNLLAKLDKRKPDPYRDIPLLSRGRCAVYSIWLVCHEVESGGFRALYAGGAGGFAELAADGLELMGAPACADAVRRTFEAPETPEGGEAPAGPDLAALSETFKEAAAREQPLALCIAYIRDNPEEFVDYGTDDTAGSDGVTGA